MTNQQTVLDGTLTPIEQLAFLLRAVEFSEVSGLLSTSGILSSIDKLLGQEAAAVYESEAVESLLADIVANFIQSGDISEEGITEALVQNLSALL